MDIRTQPNYPFEFIKCDALFILGCLIRGDSINGHEMSDFDAVHASPPCQRYSVSRHIHDSGDRHTDLVAPTRELLVSSGKPWVIENVPGSPLEGWPVTLCGLMFGLKVLRHRLFESSVMLMQPSHPKHPKGNLTNSCEGYSRGEQGFVCVAGHNFSRVAGAAAMGIDWMKTRHELAQAIPPAYTEFVGRQLINHIRHREAN